MDKRNGHKLIASDADLSKSGTLTKILKWQCYECQQEFSIAQVETRGVMLPRCPNPNGLKPCPFCGEQPGIETLGTCIDITCCVSMGLQKSDVLTIDEREPLNMETLLYSEGAEKKALQAITDDWNRRTP